MGKFKRDKPITFWVTDDEELRIKELAKKASLSVSGYCRNKMLGD